MPRLLFVLKHRDSPWGVTGYTLSSGLHNSVRFVVDMLDMVGIEAKMVNVADNNAIDAEVTAYQPTHVFIEAFWVVPEKFDVLKKLHPFVTWIVRDHSETPFIANEGIAVGWVAGYLERGVEIACNAPRALADMKTIGAAYGHPDLISYAPNYYPVHAHPTHRTLNPKRPSADDVVRIGCFGAIRPLKNHLTQAVAALQYADKVGKKLEFYINSARIEQGGNPILKNLQSLFASAQRATLVESPWLDHAAFLDLVEKMDILLQVSFSETFNIVTADAVVRNTPVVTSREVPWLKDYAIADPTNTASILNRMLEIHRQDRRSRISWQLRDLTAYCQQSKAIWWDRFGRGGNPPV